jgi:hypothetical protein
MKRLVHKPIHNLQSSPNSITVKLWKGEDEGEARSAHMKVRNVYKLETYPIGAEDLSGTQAVSHVREVLHRV